MPSASAGIALMLADAGSALGLPELRAGLANLRGQGKYSDFVIECGNQSFRVHKVIICALSEYFDKVCCGEFMVSELSTLQDQISNGA